MTPPYQLFSSYLPDSPFISCSHLYLHDPPLSVVLILIFRIPPYQLFSSLSSGLPLISCSHPYLPDSPLSVVLILIFRTPPYQLFHPYLLNSSLSSELPHYQFFSSLSSGFFRCWATSCQLHSF